MGAGMAAYLVAAMFGLAGGSAQVAATVACGVGLLILLPAAVVSIAATASMRRRLSALMRCEGARAAGLIAETLSAGVMPTWPRWRRALVSATYSWGPVVTSPTTMRRVVERLTALVGTLQREDAERLTENQLNCLANLAWLQEPERSLDCSLALLRFFDNIGDPRVEVFAHWLSELPPGDARTAQVRGTALRVSRAMAWRATRPEVAEEMAPPYDGPQALVLETDRLLLRLVSPDDVDVYLGWINDPEVSRYLDSTGMISVPYTRDEIADMMSAWPGATVSSGTVLSIICLAEGHRPIGCAWVGGIDFNNGSCSAGLLIGDRSQWGQGYGREALSAIERFCFEGIGLNRISASAYAPNERSIRLFEGAGFAREGVMRQSVRKDGEYVDEVLYGLLRSDWVARQTQDSHADAPSESQP